MITQKEYDSLKFMHQGRRSLSNTEINTVFEVAAKSGYPTGCRSCPDAVQKVINKVHYLINEFRDKSIFKVQEQVPISEVKKKELMDANATAAADQTEEKSGQTEPSETKTAPSTVKKPKAKKQ